MTAVCVRHVQTSHLRPGQRVWTTAGTVGTDFGLPLVATVHSPRARCGATTREVRSVLRESGGTVVRFTDGSKTRPIHGRTTWLEAPERNLS